MDKQIEYEQRRTTRIQQTEETLRPLSDAVYTNKDKLEQKVLAGLQEDHSDEYFDWQITKDTKQTFRQCSPGRPTRTTEFRRIDKDVYRLSWCEEADRIPYDAL